MLQKLLSSESQKQIVGVSLTPGIGLEAVVYDKVNNCVVNYGRKKVEYNFSTREIQDYTFFKTALAELMEEMRILPKTMAYLVLPNVYFDFMELPTEISDSEIKTALLSRAEEFYVFKREEPTIGYCEVINPDGDGLKRYVYTAFQKNSIDQLKDVFSYLGLHLVGVESSYSATLRGLYLTGFLNDVIEGQMSWTAMIVNTNSYTLLQMDGTNLIEYADVPLAIKSFSTEEAYQAIVSSSSQLLGNFSSQKLYIISQTEDISAHILKNAMYFEGEMEAIDTNRFSGIESMFVEAAPTVDVNLAKSITLGVIGATVVKSDFNLILNVLAGDPDASMGIYFTKNILGTDVDFTSELVIKLSIVLSGIIIAVFAVIVGLTQIVDSHLQKNLEQLKTQIQELDTQIDAESQNEPKEEVDMNIIIDEIASANVMANNFYDSIATDIPQGIWLTRYYNKTGDKIAVQGIAQSITDVYEYYKNLRIISPQSGIKLTELKVVTPNPTDKFTNNLAINSDTDRLYSFEISNIDIDFNKQEEAPKDKDAVSDDDIIIKSNKSEAPAVEQPSEQMTPTEE